MSDQNGGLEDSKTGTISQLASFVSTSFKGVFGMMRAVQEPEVHIVTYPKQAPCSSNRRSKQSGGVVSGAEEEHVQDEERLEGDMVKTRSIQQGTMGVKRDRAELRGWDAGIEVSRAAGMCSVETPKYLRDLDKNEIFDGLRKRRKLRQRWWAGMLYNGTCSASQGSDKSKLSVVPRLGEDAQKNDESLQQHPVPLEGSIGDQQRIPGSETSSKRKKDIFVGVSTKEYRGLGKPHPETRTCLKAGLKRRQRQVFERCLKRLAKYEKNKPKFFTLGGVRRPITACKSERITKVFERLFGISASDNMMLPEQNAHSVSMEQEVIRREKPVQIALQLPAHTSEDSLEIPIPQFENGFIGQDVAVISENIRALREAGYESSENEGSLELDLPNFVAQVISH